MEPVQIELLKVFLLEMELGHDGLLRESCQSSFQLWERVESIKSNHVQVEFKPGVELLYCALSV